MKRFARSTGTADANQSEIVKSLEKIGCRVWDMERPVDLLVEFRGVFIPLEVKTAKGKLTPNQEEFFRKTKGPAFIVHDHVEAVMAVQRAWKKITNTLEK